MTGLPTGWEEVPLEQICQFNPRDIGDVRPETPISFVPMPSVSDINGVITEHEKRPFSQVSKGYTRFANGDVIFAKITPCMENGKIAVAENLFNSAACGSTEFHVLRPTEAVRADYLWRFLRQISFRRIAERSMTGAVGQRRVPVQFLKNFSIPLPPVDEQKRITEKLDNLFNCSQQAREELKNIPRLIERYKHAVLYAAFRGDLTKDWRKNNLLAEPIVLPDQEFSKRKSRNIKNPDEIADFTFPFEIPEKWTWAKLPFLGSLDRGKSRHRPRNDPTLYGGPYPFIQTGDVRAADNILDKYSQTYSEIGLRQSRLWPKGTLCITIAANIAETTILGIDACFPDSIVGFVSDQSLCRVSFIEYFIRTVKEDLSRFAPATAQKNINLDTLSNVYVPTPPILEQDEIVTRIERAFAAIDAVANQTLSAFQHIDLLEAQCLDKAFKGRLVAQNANDEPVSALLERLRGEVSTTKIKQKLQKFV